MQGERSSACGAEARVNVTLIVLLFVLVCTVSFGLNEENSESAAKKRPLDLASSSSSPSSSSSSSSSESPVVSSSSSSSVSPLSPTSFTSINPHAVSTIIFDQEKTRTFEILRDLVKEDVLHLVLGEPEGQVAATQDDGSRLSSSSSSVRVGNLALGPPALRHLSRTRVVLGVEGHSLTYFWNRQDPRVVPLDEAPALLHIEEEEEEEEEEEGNKEEEEVLGGVVAVVVGGGASLQMNLTKPTAEPSKQQVSSVANMNSCRSGGRLVCVARSR